MSDKVSEKRRSVFVKKKELYEAKTQGKLLYGVEDKPPTAVGVVMGVQNILTAFGGIVAVPLIIAGMAGTNVADTAYLVSAALLCSGICTIIQSRGVGVSPFRIGSGLPTIMGTDFGFVAPASTIIVGMGGGLPAYFGASILGAVLEFILSYFVKPLLKFFPQVVTGTVITLIGMTLVPVTFDWAAGGVGASDYGSVTNLAVALIVFVIIILLNRYGKGFVSSASILIGIVVGYIICIPLDKVDFNQVAQASWFAPPSIFKFGVNFDFKFVIPFIAGYLVTVIETIGVVQVIGEVTETEVTDDMIASGVRADAFGSFLSPFLGSGPVATFSQNAGLIPLTKVASRSVAIISGVLLILISLFPKVATIVSIMPPAVLGGAGILMFGTVAASGIQNLSLVKFTNRNLIIIASSLTIGLGVTFKPEIVANLPTVLNALFSSGISAGTITAFILNIILKEEK
ncbi:uracil-xanthine permease family protein [Miniphocaeibacter halophilus]|uniref:Purine permease n=1 Tax=Miniphocaeibacter halophilus TaxID=2931922 RepID=A0AC61MYU7_9FIRM|nr:nucleobase:cation symporter-2 family protein [Miniphocaeibacter halophilus]QQK08434.1 purine permease [Miniphocaeibacter halophilus]